MAAERNLWNWLKNGTKNMKGLHLCRIESPVTPGYPDVEGCYQGGGHEGGSFHIELKAKKSRPKRATTPIRPGIRPEQIIWFKHRTLASPHLPTAWVLIRVGEKKETKVYLIAGEDVDPYIEKMTEENLGVLSKCRPDASPRDIIECCCWRF